jgi:hypothetical protein
MWFGRAMSRVTGTMVAEQLITERIVLASRPPPRSADTASSPRRLAPVDG